ncbi:MAG: dockerin type I domain-containing protein [Dehalococcoidia bacterium]
MRKIKWQAKAFYFILALAFAMGLAPLAAAPTPVAASVHADFYAYPADYAKAGETVYFYDMSTDGVPPTEWLWNFGDGQTGEGPQPSHQYYPQSQCQTYDVTLTATWVAPNGARTSSTITKQGYITVCWGLITEPCSYSYDNVWYCTPSGVDSQIGWNVLKSTGIFVVPEGVTNGFTWTNRVIGWDVSGDGHQVTGGTTGKELDGMPSDPPGPAVFPWVQVVNDGIDVGEVTVTAQIDVTGNPPSADITLSATKKWGDINDTNLEAMDYNYDTYEWVYSTLPGESEVIHYEGCGYITLPEWLGGETIERCKQQFGVGMIRERVIGSFDDKQGGIIEHPADGAVVYMFLLDSNPAVAKALDELPQTEAEAFAGHWGADKLVANISALQDLNPPRCVGFLDGDAVKYAPDGRYIEVTKTSQDIDLNGNGVIEDPDEMGWTGNILLAECEDAVKIVFVATYPDETGPELPVFAEIGSWNFWTQQAEKVPEVHWAGEKVVLEKQFGSFYAGYPVLFNLENQACGSLFPVGSPEGAMGSQQVYTNCDQYGTARAYLESQSPCEADVQASLYNWNNQLINQAGWVIFFLKFEGLTLSNVQGERTGHDAGLWDPIVDSGMVYDAFPNDIWDPTKNWVDDQFVGKTLKVWKGEMQDDGSITFIGDLQVREIVSNTVNTVVVDKNWDNIPSFPTQYLQWYYQIVDPVWNPATDDLSQQLNVSQDALLRARIKGWFMGDNKSWRPEKLVDLDGDGFNETTLDKGRWVLPDDWPILAGADWKELRPHWDIMDQPNDNIMSEIDTNLNGWEEVGDYSAWKLNESPTMLDVPGDLVAEAPVIGPYSGLDTYSPYIQEPWKLNYKTIVPNGKLNWWDCPMPPAKIIFKITDGAGFFKDCDKGDVYYQWVETDLNSNGPEGIAYTNPYYWEMIPGNPLIPPFVLNGGFDWDSWDLSYGPYPFWEVFNQLDTQGDTPADPQHPTKVEVYSDNHGEAMVWLNGDWNLDLSDWVSDGAYDVPPGMVVGGTIVKALADYPYMRKHEPIASNTVEKSWTWGKQILGSDYHEYNDFSWDPFNPRMVFQVGTLDQDGKSDKKMAFIWVCDRDGMPAVGEKIEWFLAPSGAEIPPIDAQGVSYYLQSINVTDGFLAGTLISPKGEKGGVLNPDRTRGVSFARLPSDAEKALFLKFQDMGVYPDYLDVDDYAVAAIEVLSSLPTDFDLTIYLNEPQYDPIQKKDVTRTIIRHTNLDFNVADSPDDPLIVGDANGDTAVNAGDITMIKRVYFGLETDPTVMKACDVNNDGVVDTGDITKVKGIYFGM